MIVGIGCDVVDHNQTKELDWDSDTKLQNRILTQIEIEVYNKNRTLEFIIGRFAAKEAVLKCLGTGMIDGISLKDIQINRLENGKPEVELFGEARTISENMGINSWYISISHSSNHSFAFVVAERVEYKSPSS